MRDHSKDSARASSECISLVSNLGVAESRPGTFFCSAEASLSSGKRLGALRKRCSTTELGRPGKSEALLPGIGDNVKPVPEADDRDSRENAAREVSRTSDQEHRSFRAGKLSCDAILSIRERAATGETTTALGRAFGVSQGLVSLICLGKVRRDVGGPFTRRRHQVGTLAERLRIFAIVPSDPKACWCWSGRLDKDGYPQIKFRGRDLAAHRCSLELKLGRSLRDDEVTRHTCHKRSCTNQDHLIPGSIADNNRDMIEAGRAAWQKQAAARDGLKVKTGVGASS